MVVVVVALVTWSNRRKAAQARQRRAAEEAAVPGLAEYASGQGWSGPADDPHLDEATAGLVGSTLRTLSGIGQTTESQVLGPRYANVYSGTSAGRPFVIANAWLRIDGKSEAGSVCVLHMGEALPPLFVTPRRYRPPMRLFFKEVTFESERFNRQFLVLAR